MTEQMSADIYMACDAVTLTEDGLLSLHGWASSRPGISRVLVLVNDAEAGLASYGYERGDIASVQPDIPMSLYSGFRFDRHVGQPFSGECQVHLIAFNRNDEKLETIVPVVAQPVAGPSNDLTPAETARQLAEAREFRFEIDQPLLKNGVLDQILAGRFSIEGWLLTRSGVAGIEVFLGDQKLGDAIYGLARPDVAAAFPDWPNGLRSGYVFHCQPKNLHDGNHTVRLLIKSVNGETMVRTFQILVRKPEEDRDGTAIRRRIPQAETNMMLAIQESTGYRPAFHLILLQQRTFDIGRFRATLEALLHQTYPDWTVTVLTMDSDVVAAMQAIILSVMPHLAARFNIVTPFDHAAWSAPLAKVELGRTVLFGLLRPGDVPGADALLELAVAAGQDPESEILYSDEVRLSPVSGEMEPFFKPDFSPDLLLSTNYFGRLWVVTAAALAQTGETMAGVMATGEYDLALRCAEIAGRIVHLPRLLCQRTDVALDDSTSQHSALQRALKRREISGSVTASPVPGTWRVKRDVVSGGKISIIVPTNGTHGYIQTLVTTLLAKTAQRNFELIVIDNIPDSDLASKAWLRVNVEKIVDIPEPFNWSVFNNRAAERADGEYLLFLNDDIEIVQEDWLDALLEHAQRPEVGIVGPQLLYPDGTVQHAGMFLSRNGLGRHAFRNADRNDPCYFGLALTQRNVMAVTGACMMMRRQTFDRLGGFDEAHQVTNNDLDFCLRANHAGLLTVFTPYASLIHHELGSRAGLDDVFDSPQFDRRWKTTFAAGDPYFNPNLFRHANDYQPDDEPVQRLVAGSPLYLAREIERILVVKLDHVGDFLTAMPAIRRLKKFFPHARITVLAAPASGELASLEPCIDEFIPFSFFHARSQLGEIELSQDAYASLHERLRPYKFDLAVDLRKHTATRAVLKHSGARFLAGFDHLGQFPELDVALAWDCDRRMQHKRSHIIDDLIGLVDAIGHAAEDDRAIIQPAPQPLPLTALPEAVRALFNKPVIAVHPGAGNVTKLWPGENFVALIDLLTERHDVNVLLVGGLDDVGAANRILDNVRHPHAVGSITGKASLAALPRLLKLCALFIGNDSGPKHIAGATGIPTIGIHSGVVDATEWAPVGPRAVALRRNMTCSPCYLDSAESCPRSLACLHFLEPTLVYQTARLMLTGITSVVAAPVEGQAEMVRENS